MRTHRRLTLAAAVVALVLAALPALAYTIYLKDGTRIIARDKYTVRNGQALIVLQNGTQTAIAVSEIDVARTEKANQSNLGTAVVIEGSETRDVPTQPEPERKPSLQDLARGQRGGETPAQRRPAQRPSADATPPPAASSLDHTTAGYPDLLTYPREPYPGLEVGAELKRLFTNQGIDDAQIFQGTAAGRPMVEVTASSEAAAFRALVVAAAAVVHLEEQGRGNDGLELFLATPSRQRAGQFLLTPSLARQLLSKEVDVSTFYVENVQF